MAENLQRLAAVGPLDPVHGFPLWFADANDTVLELGLGPDPNLPAIDPPTASHQVPGMEFPDFFPAEAFYFLAESRMAVGGAGEIGRARLILGLEAAFGTPSPDPRSRVVFARIRVRIDDVIPGEFYTVTHPYGITEPLQADEDGRVFVTDDRGIADNQFESVRANGLVAPFLQWASNPPPGYLGDGATERPVTGSPDGNNFFRVEGTNIAVIPGAPAPANPNRLQSNLFTVQGKRATRIGAEITAAHYARQNGSVVIDLHARSRPGQQLVLGGPDVDGVALIPESPTGTAYAARAAAGAGPTQVTVINTSDAPASVEMVTAVDRITATAVHDLAAGLLTVTATSSDETGPQLAATGHGVLTAPSTTFPAAATPATIEVTSAQGGRVVVSVSLAGATLPGQPLTADAGINRTVEFGDEVILDGRASRSRVTAWSWAYVSGPGATIVAPTDPQATLANPVPGDHVVRLTVTDTGGATDDAVVTITVQPFVPDTLTITRSDFRTGRNEHRIDGSQTGTRPAEITVEFDGNEIGTSPVDATGAWSVRLTVTPDRPELLPGVGDVVTAASSRGGTAFRPIRIRN